MSGYSSVAIEQLTQRVSPATMVVWPARETWLVAGIAAVDRVLEALGVLVEVGHIRARTIWRLRRGPDAHAPNDTPSRVRRTPEWLCSPSAVRRLPR